TRARAGRADPAAGGCRLPPHQLRYPRSVTASPFAFDGFHGEAAADFAGDPVAEARRLLDPSSAERTLHWGRNYLYVARLSPAAGGAPVVVKQFRSDSARERRRLGRGTGKARR